MSVVALKRKVNNDVDLESLLDGASVPVEPKKSKSSVPTLTVSKAVQELATRVHDLKDEMDSVTSMYEEKAAELLKSITPLRESLLRSSSYASSVKFLDTKQRPISFTWANKYSAVDYSHAKEIQEVVGKQFEDYFETSMTITVLNNSPEALKELIGLVGQENFARLFSVKRTLKPTDTFNAKQYSLSEDIRSRLAAWLKQNKPSVKV